MRDSPLDLQQLARDKTLLSRVSTTKRPRRWVSRYVIPLGILVGFVVVFGTSIAKQILPRKKVTVMPVIAKQGSVTTSGAVLFQAPGWVEPRPSAVKVTALAGGVVDELFVVEGQAIQKGEPVARLIERDAELQVEQAEATLEIANGEVQRALAEETASAARLHNPTHRRAELAEAKSLLARANAELARLPSLFQAAEARVKFARLSQEGKSMAGNAVAAIVVEQSRCDSVTAGAELSDLKSRQPHLADEVASLQSRVMALEEQLQLLIEEQRAFSEAAASLISAEASRHLARVHLDRARLNLERTTIRAPLSGRVLRVVASPGSRVIGLDESTGQNAAVIVEMYDPNRLQIRADVRLEDVPMVISGAPVEIETASSGTKLEGLVLQSTSSANVQKNTLEVKVELLNPPGTVTPEMLVKVTFLAPVSPQQPEVLTESQHLFIPTQLIQSGTDGSTVWVATPEGVAMRKSISVGAETGDGLTEVIHGLVITDKLIASGTERLQPGELIESLGDDQLLGLKR